MWIWLCVRCKYTGGFLVREWSHFLRGGLYLWYGQCAGQSLKLGDHPGGKPKVEEWLNIGSLVVVAVRVVRRGISPAPEFALQQPRYPLHFTGKIYTLSSWEGVVTSTQMSAVFGNCIFWWESPVPFLRQPKCNDRLMQGHKGLVLWTQCRTLWSAMPALELPAGLVIPADFTNFSLHQSCFSTSTYIGVDP